MKVNIPANDESQYVQRLFAAGENHVKFKVGPIREILHGDVEAVTINYSYTGDNSILTLLQATDALKRMGAKKIDLVIPYFPGARQDRVCDTGEALSVKIYADLINSQKYNQVTIFDPHSEVTPALLDNVKVVDNCEFVKHALRDIETIYRDELMAQSFFKDQFYTNGGIFDSEKFKTPLVLVSPDGGALKKVFKLSAYLGGLEVVRADKTRDTKTGKLGSPTVYADDLSGKICCIADDISSFGGTFKALAVELKKKGAAKIYLIVSHWEGVANLDQLNESGIDWVYTTDSLKREESQNLLTVYDVWRFIN